MDNKEQLNKLKENKRHEVFVDFTNDQYGKLEININFNKILSIKRKEINIIINSYIYIFFILIFFKILTKKIISVLFLIFYKTK